MGPIVTDGVTGESLPTRFATKQRGLWVDKRLNRNAWDRPDWYVWLGGVWFLGLMLAGQARWG